MKIVIKISILVIAISLAIGGVMIYAKTKVEPPTALKQSNQYLNDLKQCDSSLKKAKSAYQEDSIYSHTVNRIQVFQKEGKISTSETDSNYDKLLASYIPLFMKRSFAKFANTVWYEDDHAYMLSVISGLKSIKHFNQSSVLTKSNLDSLSTITKTISNYRQARAISLNKHFNGVNNAQSIISQARSFADNEYLSKCTDLRNALNKVSSNIEQSHYNYISSQVEKLSQYHYYNKEFYENTLIPQVDASVSEYEKKASALYGSKRDVNTLWNKARSYYNEASNYYDKLSN